MIRLTDDQMTAVWMAARTIPHSHRDRFLQLIAEALRPHPDPGPGTVDRAIRAATAAMRRGWMDAG